MRASVCKRIVVCLIVIVLSALPMPGVCAGAKLNVLLIFVDDLRTTIGVYGDNIAKTPNIDRLAAEGAVFIKAYCQYPLCNPSRTSCLSGKRPATTGIIDNGVNPRTRLPDAVFLPEYFKARGYYTARFGKIEHNAWPDVIHWDLARDDPGSVEDVSRHSRQLPGWKASVFADEQLPDGQIARWAVEFVEQHAATTFFLGVGFRKPHRPLVAPRKYFDLYDVDSMPLPTDALVNDEFTVRDKREAVRAYYACVSYIDAQIGLLLDSLERSGLRQHTLIVLTSDHGVTLGEGNRFVTKQSLHEYTLRIPLILSGPGVPCGLSLDQLVELVDLYPTMAEMCGLARPPDMEGLSFVPLIQDPALQWKSAVFSECSRGSAPGTSLRTDRYRYVSFTDGRESLFDLESSFEETVDLARSHANRKLVKQMRKLLRRGWRRALPQ